MYVWVKVFPSYDVSQLRTCQNLNAFSQLKKWENILWINISANFAEKVIRSSRLKMQITIWMTFINSYHWSDHMLYKSLRLGLMILIIFLLLHIKETMNQLCKNRCDQNGYLHFIHSFSFKGLQVINQFLLYLILFIFLSYSKLLMFFNMTITW